MQHLIVSDRADNYHARGWAETFGFDYIENTGRCGEWGKFAHQLGLDAAKGDYVCFWDQDNIYYPNALQTLWKTLYGGRFEADIAIGRVHYRHRTAPAKHVIPKRWEGTFKIGDIDTMCCLIKKSLARKERWDTTPDGEITNDFAYFKSLERHHPVIHCTDRVIGWHL